jgi:HD-like signal output (HDOD) protein
VLDEKKSSQSEIYVVEKNIFGFDHQELGSEILKEWGLPEDIYMPIRYHHKNEDSPSDYALSTDILYVSDKISSIYHGNNGSDKIQDLKTILGNGYKKSEEETESLIDTTADKSIEILSLFEIDPANMKPYSEILQEANEELKKLNLSYEELLIKFKEAKDRAEILAGKLKAANKELRTLALRDGLTGLYNRRYFQEQLDVELNRVGCGIKSNHKISKILFTHYVGFGSF